MAETVHVPDIEQAEGHRSPSVHHNEQVPSPDFKVKARPQDIKRVETQKVVVLSFRSLQLRRIAELQDELLGLAVKTARTPNLPDTHNSDVDKALHDYADALRNYETLSLNGLSSIPTGAILIGTMARAGAEPPPLSIPLKIVSYAISKIMQIFPERLAPFAAALAPYGALIKASPSASATVRGAIRLVLNERGSYGPSSMVDMMEIATGNLGFRELDQQGRLLREQKKAFTGRVAMALFGGVSLIVPMLVMTLHPSRNTSLITTSAATFVFAIALAVGATDTAGKDVLAATAAYAAVLVVFVGTSAPGNG